MPDPQTAALIAAARGDSSQIPPPNPDSMQANPANIPQAGVPGQSDVMELVKSLFALPENAQPRSALEEQRGKLQDLESQRANLPIPSTGPSNLFLRILSGTAPGAAISDAVYGPGVQRYNAQRAQLADRIANLKEQTGISKDELTNAAQTTGAGTNVFYKGNMVQQGQDKIAIQQQKSDTYRQSVQNKLEMGMRGLDLNALRTGSQLELNKARIMLDQVMAQVLPSRVEMEGYGIDVNSATRQAVADLEAQAGLEKTHPFLNMLDQTLGTHLMPAAPQTPGGAHPVRGEKPLPKKGQTKSPVQSKGKVLVEGKDF